MLYIDEIYISSCVVSIKGPCFLLDTHVSNIMSRCLDHNYSHFNLFIKAMLRFLLVIKVFVLII